jgi:hypothetical protein
MRRRRGAEEQRCDKAVVIGSVDVVVGERMIRSHEELNVYQLAFEAAMKIFEHQDPFVQILRKLGAREDMKLVLLIV